MKKIFLILLLHITFNGFAQNPRIEISVNGVETECENSFEEPCVNYSCLRIQYDSIILSATFPKMYLQYVDSIEITLDTLLKSGNHSSLWLINNGLYTIGRNVPGVCVSCSAPQYNISVFFKSSTELFEDYLKFTRWEDNYAYTGGLWERCGLAANITNPYIVATANSQIIYSVYEAVGCCNAIPECGKLIGQIHQFFDYRGRCVKETMGDVTVIYSYSKGGMLKQEHWTKNDSVSIATIKYTYRGHKKKTSYWLPSSCDIFSIIKLESDCTIKESCYNENGALLWTRSTKKDSSTLECITEINGDNSLLYNKVFNRNGNIQKEGLIDENHSICYEYTKFYENGDWNQAVIYETFYDLRIPVKIVNKNIKHVMVVPNQKIIKQLHSR